MKTSYYRVTTPHFSPESPIDGSTLRFRNSLDLPPLPLGVSSIVIVEPSAPHLHNLHDHNIRQMTTSNYTMSMLQSLTRDCRTSQLVTRVHPEMFLLGTMKRVHTQRGAHIRFWGGLVPMPMSLIFPMILESAWYSTYHTSRGPEQFSVYPLQLPLRSLCSSSRFDFIIHTIVIR